MSALRPIVTDLTAHSADKHFRLRTPISAVALRVLSAIARSGLFPNRTASIDAKLGTTWYYKKLKLVLGHQTIGPISGEEFLAVYSAGKLYDDTQVMSPELTHGNWVDLHRMNLTVLKNRIGAHALSERSRRQTTAQQRKNEIAAENRRRLQRAVSTAISDGRITLNERSQLVDFAVKAGIPSQEVEELIQQQSGAT